MAVPLDKDSAIIELLAAEDGYFVRAWKWPITPPPVGELAPGSFPSSLDHTDPMPTFRTDRVSTTKAELKTELNAFIDSVFDMP